MAGAQIGGMIGGGVGGGIQSSLNGGSGFQIVLGALMGAQQGYATGTSFGNGFLGASAGGGGPPTQTNYFGLTDGGTGFEITGVKELISAAPSKTGSILNSIFGSTLAYAADPLSRIQSRRNPENNINIRINSRPAVGEQLRHLYAVREDTGETIELLNREWINEVCVGTCSPESARQGMQNALTVSVDKVQFESALKELTNRYHGASYKLKDNSNNFIINLLQKAGRALTGKELEDLGVTQNRATGIWASIFVPRIFYPAFSKVRESNHRRHTNG